MFVNKNVKSFKNVNKTKHHKRNKNKKRSIKKLSIKYMRGGSGASGASGAIIHIPTLLKLIHSKANTMCEIHYDDVKIICLLGNNIVKLGYDTTQKKECILITYNMDGQSFHDPEVPYYNATLNFFFCVVSKQDCLYSKNNNLNSLIDNSVYFNNFNKNKGNNNYSKSINTLLLELVDTINILVGVKYCQLIDAATVNCTKNGGITLSLGLKHITKGYGFYNEFGYLYTKAISIYSTTRSQDTKYDLLDLKFANFILTNIDKQRIHLKREFSDLEKQCTKTLKDSKADNSALDASIKAIREPFTVFTNNIINTVKLSQIYNADQQAKQQAKQQNITITMPIEVPNIDDLFNMFIKRYEYKAVDTVSKSELIKERNPIQDPPQETPYHFAMVNYTKPTITITSLQAEQPPKLDKPDNPDKPVYLITITKGTKI